MRTNPVPTTEDLIRAAVHKFTAPRGERFISVGGGRVVRVHTAGERILHLPNGEVVRVAVDDSGVATHVETGEALHAIARPHPIRMRIETGEPR